MPFSGSVENEDDLMARVMLDPMSVIGQQYAQPQQGAAGGLPQTMAQYQPMQRPLQARAQPRSPQASRTDEQLGLALMLSGDDKLSGVGQTLFPKTLGADDGYKEQMADIRHQETMQQRYAQMNQPKTPLVSNVNTVGGSQPGWEPLGTSGQFYRADSQGVPQVFAAPGSTAHATQLDEQQDRLMRQERRRSRAETVAPTVLRDVSRAFESADFAGPVPGAIAEYAGQKPTSLGSLVGIGIGRRAADKQWQLNADLDSVKSNISIDALQQMREMSPTGGALGQVPVQQQEYLMQLLGTLSASLPPEKLRENLAQVRNEYLKSYAYALYGNDTERQMLVARGEMAPQEAAQAKQQHDLFLQQELADTGWTVTGGRTGRPASLQGGSPQEPGGPPPLDVEVNTPRMGSGPVQVQSIEEAMALPPGTPFIDPQGTPRIR